MFGITPRTLWVTIAYEIKMSRERAAARRAEKETFAEEDEVPHTWQKPELPPYSGEQQPLSYTDNTGDMEKTPVFGKRKKKNFDVDVAVDDPEAQPVASEETAENPKKSPPEKNRGFPKLFKRKVLSGFSFHKFLNPKPIFLNIGLYVFCIRNIPGGQAPLCKGSWHFSKKKD
jgi:hypothetical protein